MVLNSGHKMDFENIFSKRIRTLTLVKSLLYIFFSTSLLNNAVIFCIVGLLNDASRRGVYNKMAWCRRSIVDRIVF